MEDGELSIGEVAARSGISVSAIRYYERRGILPPPARESGQRRFAPDTVARLRIVAVAKRAGFSLEQVRLLLASVEKGAPAHESLRALAALELPAAEASIERAQARRDWLLAAGSCECESLSGCALFA